MSTLELDRHQLAVGEVLAEGGEGRVHQLADRDDTVYKAYKAPVPVPPLRSLVAWPDTVSADAPALARRVRAGSAWPTAVVIDPNSGSASGLLMPRAPERFWLSHRDGVPRLASLSYLTADPGHRAASYGLALPHPMSAERLGLAYALARLLAAFDGASPAVVHGDLSARNVLWSLRQGPEVFVLDCDNAETYLEGAPVMETDRRRAMTPNWDDPAVPAGSNPGLFSDRYSLALIFLRIVGAAHFPIQARQRRGEPVSIDFDLPGHARRLASLERSAPLWGMVAWGLNRSEPESRPTPAAWSAALEGVLDEMGEAATVRQVWANQEGLDLAYPSEAPPAPRRRPLPADVHVRPVAATPRTQAWRIATSTEIGESEGAPAEPPMVVVRRYARYALVWWWLAHRRMVRSLIRRGQRGAGARRLVFLLFADFAIACMGLFLFAMMVSPFFGL